MKDRYTIFFDLDGTLVDDFDTVDPESVRLIKELRSKGHLCFVNTGRGIANIPAEIRDVMDGCITVTGASCFYHGEPVFVNPMAEEVINEFASYCLERNIPLFMENNEAMAAAVPSGCPLNALTADLLPFVSKTYGSMAEYLEDDSFTTLKLDTELVYLDLFRDELAKLAGKLHGVESGDWYEILVEGNDKGTAIRKTVELLHLDPEKTVCIGDSDNDLAMFEACKIRIAVAEASEKIKGAAEYVLGKDRFTDLFRLFEETGLI